MFLFIGESNWPSKSMNAGSGDERLKVATWRSRAEELRTIAETFHFQEPRALLLKMAGDYDTMADRLQDSLRDRDRGS